MVNSFAVMLTRVSLPFKNINTFSNEMIADIKSLSLCTGSHAQLNHHLRSEIETLAEIFNKLIKSCSGVSSSKRQL